MLRHPQLANPIKLVRFAVVGCAGFATDGSVMMLLMAHGNNVVESRFLSFLVAVTVTWVLNRTWTFSDTKRNERHQEYFAYLVTQGIGAGINLGIFFLFLEFYPSQRKFPLLALAVGAIPALAFNFTASKYLVFRRDC